MRRLLDRWVERNVVIAPMRATELIERFLTTGEAKARAAMEASTGDDPSAIMSDAAAQVTKAIGVLKQMKAAGPDQKDLAHALAYLEGGVIMLNRIVARNVQKR